MCTYCVLKRIVTLKCSSPRVNAHGISDFAQPSFMHAFTDFLFVCHIFCVTGPEEVEVHDGESAEEEVVFRVSDRLLQDVCAGLSRQPGQGEKVSHSKISIDYV